MLERFEVPSWVGRLPKVVGEPSGGSLSSDEWKWLATTFGPTVLPPLWYLTQAAADNEYAAATKRYHTKLRTYHKLREQAEKSLKSDALTAWHTKHPSPLAPHLRRVEDEIPMFLSLAASLQLLLGRSLADQDVQRGGSLLLEHLKRYCEIYGEEYLKFNQHWSTHMPPQVPDFGPVYGFWEFPGERVNKSLKNINTNNRRRGELELTMLRTHIQGILLSQTLDTGERSLTDGPEREVLRHLLADTKALRGTVDNVIAEQDAATTSESLKAQALSDELLGQRAALQLAPPGDLFRLMPREQHALVTYYRGLGLTVHAGFDATRKGTDSAAISAYGYPHSFIVLDGRRIIPSSGTTTSSNLVKLRRTDDDTSLTPCHGEILNIFSHHHLSMKRTFATVRTFVDYAPGLMRGADWGKWSLYPEVEVEYWYPDRYGPVKVVPVEDIVCQIGRAWFEDPDIWMTVSLEKHRIRR